jgi:hypothetical protein
MQKTPSLPAKSSDLNCTVASDPAAANAAIEQPPLGIIVEQRTDTAPEPVAAKTETAENASCGCVLLEADEGKPFITAAVGEHENTSGPAMVGDGTINGSSAYFADGPRFHFTSQSMELAGPWGHPGKDPHADPIIGHPHGNGGHGGGGHDGGSGGDGNHAPTGIEPCHLSVDENSGGGTVVGQLHTSDPDAGDKHVYEIVGGNSLFEIDGDVIRVKPGAQLDYETQDSYELTVRSTDSHGKSVVDTVHIDIRDVNEAPAASQICDQTAPAGSHFSLDTSGHFSDVDHCDRLTYSISGPEWLSIDPHTGVISGNVPASLAAQNIAICDGSAALPSSGLLHLQTDFLYSYAGYNNSVGYYIADANGNPIGGAIIESGAHQFGQHDTFIDLSQYQGAASLGFFLIQDGASVYSGLSDGTQVTFAEVDGVWKGYANGTLLDQPNGTVLFSNQDLNPDGYDHLEAGDGAQMGWEDLWQGGDKDFDDVGMNAKLELIQLHPADGDQTVTVTAMDKGGLTAQTSFHLDLTDANATFDSYQAGDDGANLLIGNAASNILSGGAGDDTLIGSSGRDYLVGGSGNDTLHGGLGSDALIGGSGSDRFVFTDLHDLDTVHGGTGGTWTDVIDLSGLPASSSHDWTLVLTHGSIISQTANDITLSTDAEGAIHVGGETRIAFHGIESIHS